MANSILTPDAKALEDERAAEPVIHHDPHGFSDRFALGFTKLLRFAADTFLPKDTVTAPLFSKPSRLSPAWLGRCSRI